MPLISLQNVTRTYRPLDEAPVEALKGIDLQVEQGEFVAIWGPSGSGKSTLCNLIGTIDLPTGGTVLVNQRNIAQLSDNQLSEHRNRSVGFIFQDFNLIKVLSALENILLPLTLRGADDSQGRTKALQLLDEMGLSDVAQRRPDQLSGGQQQRVAIARALITAPPLVIADEPTANLDSVTASRIIDQMAYFNRTHGTTFIFSTHDQRLLDQVARKIQLQDGMVLQDVRTRHADQTQRDL